MLGTNNLNFVQLNVRELVTNLVKSIFQLPSFYFYFWGKRIFLLFIDSSGSTHVKQNQTHNLFDPHGVVYSFLHHETNLWGSDGIRITIKLTTDTKDLKSLVSVVSLTQTPPLPPLPWLPSGPCGPRWGLKLAPGLYAPRAA